MVMKGRLNELPDELILTILSKLPTFKESVATRLISRRYEVPWNLAQDVTLEDNDEESLISFVYGSLLSEDAPVLERLHLKLNRYHSASAIDFLVQTAVNRNLRKLRFDLFGETLETLPSCLSSCTTLKSLILREVSIVVVPYDFRLPSLKSLHLFSVKFLGLESVASLLRSCPALEDLFITRTKYDNVWLFNITVPTLKSLSINNAKVKRADAPGFAINAPALERLNVKDRVSNFMMFGYMPEVTTANIEVVCEQTENFIGSLTFIQHLSLCSPTSKTPYTSGTVFFFLEHLELCTCSARWADLLGSILNDAPRLQSIKLKSKCGAGFKRPMELWNEPIVVPECLAKHLEFLEWREYDGTEQERKVAAYILASATCLKMATFSTRCGDKCTELNKMSRVSEICQLVFE
nr:PREDICTED: putative FBD-associated F-box protein At5g56560 isoform X2 [Raphanus sativus]